MIGPTPPPVAGRPWYRVGMVWLVIALPVLTVVAGVLMVGAANREGIDAEPEPVQRVAQIQTTDLVIDQATRALGLRGYAEIDAAAGQLRLHLPDMDASTPLDLQWVHATRAVFDRRIALRVGADGVWSAALPSPRHGRYQLRLLPRDRSWRLLANIDDSSRQFELIPAFAP